MSALRFKNVFQLTHGAGSECQIEEGCLPFDRCLHSDFKVELIFRWGTVPRYLHASRDIAFRTAAVASCARMNALHETNMHRPDASQWTECHITYLYIYMRPQPCT